MKVNFAHVRLRARNGSWLNVAVFDACSTSGSQEANSRVLAQLIVKARAARLRIDQAALAFTSSGRLRFHGSPALVDFLSRSGRPSWTHSLQT